MPMTDAVRFQTATGTNDFTAAVQTALNRHGHYVINAARNEGGYIPTPSHLTLARVAVESPHIVVSAIALRLLTVSGSDGYNTVEDAIDGIRDNLAEVFEAYADVLFMPQPERATI